MSASAQSHMLSPAVSADKATILDVSNVNVWFDGIGALRDVSFKVNAGEICGLIGPNGAGKTTLFNCINGLVPISGGQICFRGQSLQDVPTYQIVNLGISRTFQNIGLYGELSVLENVQLGGHSVSSGGFFSTALRMPWVRREEQDLRTQALKCLNEVGLADIAAQQTGILPYGTLKRIEIARALMSSPQLLMLDEPAGGLSHGEVAELGDLIRRLRRERQLTLLLVEHHMRLVMELCTHVGVLSQGAVLADGAPNDVQNNADVAAVYFGSSA